MKDLSFFIALGAGFLSFFSPCVLPLIPAYVSFISGLSLEELTAGGERKPGQIRRILAPSLLFVLGFSFVFIVLGASATFLGSFLLGHLRLLKFIGGVLVIIFGLNFLGLFKIKSLQYEKRFHLERRIINLPASLRLSGSFLVGMTFAFAWTPCVGPILASILALAATRESVGEGSLLLSAYSVGLGLPFLASGFVLGSFLNIFSKIKRYLGWVLPVCGVFLIIVGLVMIMPIILGFW